MRAICIIWYRDLLKYWRTKERAISALIMPFMWLVMFGSGISSSLGFQNGDMAGFQYTMFLFPGVLGVTVLFNAMFAAFSIVTDRQAGFLKEVMVTPIPRGALLIGVSLGGATVATIQGILMIVLLPLIGLPLSWGLLALIPFVFLLAFMISAIGVLAATRLKTVESFQMVMQFLTFPMFMLSGALFPLKNLPTWLDVLSKLNPVTYGIDLLRKISFYIFEVPSSVTSAFTITVRGTEVTPFMDMMVLSSVGVLVLILAAWFFSKEEA